ncbi:MAG: DHH family phosphoesterase [Bacteroidetes bacterium]|nr:DHH family phosphoesterase [Bacteroidota bacterium]MDA0903084.1 DHH family phosphoesterase [Bacteroidota bacterium]MDA1241706.1 DHH family phosphoesterase [Bacteroidota bacterium]
MEDVFSSPKVLALRDEVLAASHVAITAHRSPDGDAVGSALALRHLLSGLGVKSTVVLPDAYAAFLHWMPGHEQVVLHEQEPVRSEHIIQNSEVVFCLDFNALSRAGHMAGILEAACASATLVVMVDHHQEPETFADLMCSDPRAGSTAELVFRLMCAWGEEQRMTQEMASCLYCGLITDTGSFRFPSVTPATHRMAASLLATGMDHSRVHSLVYDTNRLDQVQLTAYALSQKLQVFAPHRTAVISLSLEELERFNAQKGDTEGLVNRALSIEGVNLAVFVKEDVGRVKMSFRSRGSFSVRDVAAEHFHGGGHHNAAGGACEGESLGEVLSRLESLIPEWSHRLQYDD